jgi:hypothetical protein
MTRPTRILIGVLGTFLFLLILAVIVVKVVFTRERVLAVLTPQLERVVDRPVGIADAGITLWNGIGIRLERLTFGSPPGFAQEPMLSVGTLDIKARFWPLLSGRVVIDRIVLAEPYVLVEFDGDGRSNFDGLLKSGTPTDTILAGSDREKLSVATVLIQDARLAWRDKRAARWIDLYGADAELHVDAASRENPAFIASLVFDSLMLFQGERRTALRVGRPSLYLDGSWNRSSRTLILDSTVAEWWGARLTAAGQIRFLPSLYEVGFNARLGSVRVKELIREIHSAFPLPKLEDLTASMSGSFEARFVWPMPENTIPEWQGRFELVDLRWPLPQTGAVVSIPRVEIHGGDRSVSWSATGGQITGGAFSTSGTIDQLFHGEQTFSARLQANMPLEGTRGLLPEAWRSSLAGTLDLDLTGFGTADRWEEMNVNGRVNSERLMLSDADWEFDSVSMALDCRLTGHSLQLSRCDWVAGDSRGALTGRIEEIIPAVLSGFTAPDVPHGQFDIVCPYLNLDRIIGDDQSATGVDTSSGPAERIPHLSINGNLTADTLIYNGLTISAARSPYVYKDRVFSLTPISGQVFGGTIGGRLDWNLNTWPQPEFFTSLSADGVEANDFFSRYFGWAGGIYGQMSLSGEFSGRGRIARQILPTLIARGRLDLSSARLESAPLLAGIGKALRVEGLDRPRSLRDLRLPFRVEDGRVITDELRINWDDVAYSARGSLGLDQSLSYQVTATTKNSRAPRVFQGVGVKFAVTGTVADPAVTVDAAGTARGLLDNVVKETKDTLQKTLDQKFKDFFAPRKP